MTREILLTSSPDSPITAYDSLTGTDIAHFSGSHSPRHGLTLVGPTLLAASHLSPNTPSSGFIRLYNWWSPTAFHSIPAPEPVAPIVATRDGSYLFSGGLSGRIHVFALPSGTLHRSVNAHCQPVSCLAIDNDGFLLVSAGDDGTLAVFPILQILDSTSSCLPLYRVSAHESGITGIALGPGGRTVVSSSIDRTCKFWSVANGAHLRTVRFACEIWCVAVEDTNAAAYAGGSDGRVHVVPIVSSSSRRGESGDEVAAAWGSEESGSVTAVAMADGNRSLVSGSEDGILRIYEVGSGVLVRIFGEERVGGFSSLLVVAKLGNSSMMRNECVIRSNNCEGEILRDVGEMEEMEEKLNVVTEDRRRAIELLEVAMETYESLLALLLKEAKGGIE